MKFSETDFDFRFTNQTDFLRSITVGLIFVPFHFVCDVARKTVFLRREKIEAWLLGSVYFSTAVVIASLLYSIFLGQIFMFGGKFPLIVPLFSSGILFLMYAAFRSTVFKLYDDLQDFVFLDKVLTENINDMEQISLDDAEFEIVGEPEITDVPDSNVTLNNTAGVHDSKQETATELQAGTGDADLAKKAVGAGKIHGDPFIETLNMESKKTIYRNAILQSIQKQLASVKSNRSIAEKDLEEVCKNQVFLAATDFDSSSIDLDIDTILFQEKS